MKGRCPPSCRWPFTDHLSCLWGNKPVLVDLCSSAAASAVGANSVQSRDARASGV